MNSKSKLLVVPHRTKLCVEGFPRSGNSSLSWEIVRLRKDLYTNDNFISHHTHSTAQMRLAIVNKIPTFCIIRNPIDSIISYHIYSGSNISVCIKYWMEFYNSSRGMHKNFHVIDFDSIVLNTEKIARTILKTSGLLVDADDEHEEFIRNEKKINSNNDEKKISTPLAWRDDAKRRVMSEIDARQFAPAMNLYNFYKSLPQLGVAGCSE